MAEQLGDVSRDGVVGIKIIGRAVRIAVIAHPGDRPPLIGEAPGIVELEFLAFFLELEVDLQGHSGNHGGAGKSGVTVVDPVAGEGDPQFVVGGEGPPPLEALKTVGIHEVALEGSRVGGVDVLRFVVAAPVPGEQLQFAVIPEREFALEQQQVVATVVVDSRIATLPGTGQGEGDVERRQPARPRAKSRRRCGCCRRRPGSPSRHTPPRCRFEG